MSDWPSVPLGDVLQRRREGIDVQDVELYKRLTIRMNGRGIAIRDLALGSQIGTKRQFVTKSGQLILSKIDARNGAFGIVPPECDKAIITGNFWTFDTDPSRLDARFLNYLTMSPLFVDFCVRASEGTTNRRYLQEPKFLAQRIDLPHLDEQRRIVARIEKLTAKIEEACSLRRQGERLAEAVFRSSLAALMRPDDALWKQGTVGGLIQSMDAGWSPQCEDRPAVDNEWGVLKTTSVQWGEFRPQENKALPAGFRPKPELCVAKGDVLVTRAGPLKRVGVVAVVRKADARLTISDKLIRLRPNSSKIDSRFLELSLASPFSQQFIVQRKTGLADAQVNISQDILRSTPVAYPALTEQHRIVAHLDTLKSKVNKLKNLQSETAAELAALMPSILSKAFRGEL